MVNYKPHKLSTLFPRADASDTERIKNDIIRYGCRVPIVLHEGKILDGLTRYEICKRYRRKPFFRTFHGTHEEAIAHVTSLNLCRRHLTQAQKSAVALSLSRMLEQNGASPSEARAEASHEAKVSEDSVRRMERVDKADKKVTRDVRDGRLSIAEAERQVDPPCVATLAREDLLSGIAALKRAQKHDVPQDVAERIEQAIRSAEKALESEWFDFS